MKSFLTLLTTFVLMLGLAGHAEAAKKFGSGGLGKSYNTTQTTPQKTAPMQQQQATPTQQQQAQPATAANQPAASKGNFMKGMLGGLLAGGLFAWLLGSGAFEGIQFMDILMIAGVGLLIFMLLRRKAAAQPQPAMSAAGAGGMGNYQEPVRPDPMARTEPMPRQQAVADPVMPAAGAAMSSMMTGNSAPMNLPADFDRVAFIGAALDHYRAVQQAWNDGDMEKIRGYVDPDLFEGLVTQRAEMESEPPRTEVLDLSADIVRADQEGSIRQISVLFRGRCRDVLENSEDGIFDTWHLERDTSKANAPWLVVGIEAE